MSWQNEIRTVDVLNSSYLGVVRLFHLLNKGNQVKFIIFGRANVRAFHEIHFELTLLTRKAHITKSCMSWRPLKYLKSPKTNSVDQDQTAPVEAVEQSDLGPHCLSLCLC